MCILSSACWGSSLSLIHKDMSQCCINLKLNDARSIFLGKSELPLYFNMMYCVALNGTIDGLWLLFMCAYMCTYEPTGAGLCAGDCVLCKHLGIHMG